MKRKIAVTLGGKDVEAYQRIRDVAAEADAAEGIRQGLEDLKGARTRPARMVFEALGNGWHTAC